MQFGCFSRKSNAQDNWAALLCESVRIKSTNDFEVKFIWTHIKIHSSTLKIQCRSGFVFLMCFSKWAFPEFKFTSSFFLIKLGRAILNQVCRVHEILPLWSGTYQWTVKYNFLYWKINLDRISVHIVGVCSSFALEQNEVQATLATLLVHSQSGRMKRRVKLTRIGFGLVVVHRSTPVSYTHLTLPTTAEV